MRVRTPLYRWLFAAVAAPFIAFLTAAMASLGGKAFTEDDSRYLSSGQDWNHKFSCSMRADDGNGDVTGTVFLWLRSRDSQYRSTAYLLATDATFTSSALKTGGYPISFWRNVEKGSGTDMCLDHVSRDSAGKPLPPYCEVSFNYATLEYRMQTAPNVYRRGLCQELTAP